MHEADERPGVYYDGRHIVVSGLIGFGQPVTKQGCISVATLKNRADAEGMAAVAADYGLSFSEVGGILAEWMAAKNAIRRAVKRATAFAAGYRYARRGDGPRLDPIGLDAMPVQRFEDTE